jgi:hypothetical protein
VTLTQLKDIEAQLQAKRRKAIVLEEELLGDFLDEWEVSKLSEVPNYGTAFQMIEKSLKLIEDRLLKVQQQIKVKTKHTKK